MRSSKDFLGITTKCWAGALKVAWTFRAASGRKSRWRAPTFGMRKCLILDEPTAALDARSEFEVFQRFAELTAGKSALFISHRFSTVRMADRIVVLENGKITEDGNHDTLLISRDATQKCLKCKLPVIDRNRVIGIPIPNAAEYTFRRDNRRNRTPAGAHACRPESATHTGSEQQSLARALSVAAELSSSHTFAERSRILAHDLKPIFAALELPSPEMPAPTISAGFTTMAASVRRTSKMYRSDSSKPKRR